MISTPYHCSTRTTGLIDVYVHGRVRVCAVVVVQVVQWYG